MPSHSRTRDRNSNRQSDRERDRDRDRDGYYHSRHRRYNADDRRLYRERETGDGNGNEDEDETDADYRRQQYRSARRSRGQSSRPERATGTETDVRGGYHEVEVEEDEGDGDDDDDTENSNYKYDNNGDKPRTPPPPTRRTDDRVRDEYSRRTTRTGTRARERTPKAKESPATSPKKRLDREGHRRNKSRTPRREGSPLVRERKQRHRNNDDDGEEQRRQQRRRERERERELRDREYTAKKHTSTDSGNSASQLLSADALAKLNGHYERERARTVYQQEDDERRTRRERRRQQKTRDIVAVEDDNTEEEDIRNNGRDLQDDIRVQKRRQRRQQSERRDRSRHAYDDYDDRVSPRQDQKRRLVSGAVMEEGQSHKLFFWRRFGRRNEPAGVEDNDADHDEDSDGGDGGGGGHGRGRYSNDVKDPGDYNHVPFWRRKKTWMIAGAVALILAIVIPVAIVESRKKSSSSSSSSSSTSSSSSSSNSKYGPYNSSLSTISESEIPASAKGTILDPFTWYDTRDFNLTYTNETVGGLSVMGLNSTWDDSAQPNSNVPALNDSFPYGTIPIRGVNVGGWLSIEPFITPSLFSGYSSILGIVDEWTLSKYLGDAAANTIESHYTTFIQEADFAAIAAAGLDHVRIPYSYWAVTTYEGDPYVPQISWRYLLRAIEYCRKYGLRVNLDLHGLPGSQNGMNHSGRQGLIRWLNGTNGTLNGQRSLDIHNQLSQFFAQPRYENVVAIYGLANEPAMLDLSVSRVLNWTVNATEIVQSNGVTAKVVFSDGFLNLDKWHYMLKDDAPSNMLLDTHQYTIFNINEIDLNHTAKINLICNSWLPMIEKVNSTSNGWGPTICGEFSQSDTDCATYLNNVNAGTRWEGTLDVSTPDCYLKDSSCSCSSANAAVSDYSDAYKLWLRTYAEAQMSAFETSLGWFYWTWETESAPQWSYKKALAGGFMPQLAYQPNFTCSDTVPSFGDLPESY